MLVPLEFFLNRGNNHTNPVPREVEGCLVDFFIPHDLSRFTIARLGATGEAWLGQLPTLVAEFEQRWAIRVERAFEPGGVIGFVAPATLADRTPVVFKISIPDRETMHEGAALRLYDGIGAVRLRADDKEKGALLLERCLPGTPLLDSPDENAANSIAVSVLRQLWRTRVPPGHPFDRATDRAAEWAKTIRREFAELGRPFETDLAAQAASLFKELSTEGGPQVLLHQDFHHGNILAGQRQPWLAIDPKPLVGDPAFDAGTLLRDRKEALLSDPSPRRRMARRLDQLADECELDRERMRAWALAQGVELGLWSLGVGDREGGERDIACASLLADC